MRRAEGQAATEYVALVALVAVGLGLGAALTSGGLGPRIAHALRLGLCRVGGEACPAPPADRADLGACLRRRSSRGQEAAVDVAFVRLGGGLGVVREEHSDGRVVLTFLEDARGGVGAGVGAAFRAGGLGPGAEAALDVSVGWNRGRSWRFPDGRAADAFLARHGSDQTLLGRTANDVRRLCLVCRRLGGEPARPPEPDVRWDEVEGRGRAEALLGLGDGADASVVRSAALGWRRDRAGGGSLYLTLGREATAELFVLGTGAAVAGRAAGTLEIAYDARRRPVALRLKAVGQAGRGGADRAGAEVPGLSRGFAGPSRLVEAEAEIPLDGSGGPALLRAAVGGLHAPAGLRALLAAGGVRGRLTTRIYALRESRRRLGGSIALGARAGATLGSREGVARLEAEWVRLPGLPWRPRDDCGAG